MTTLLLADDEQTFLDFMIRLLQKEHHLLIARNWNEVLEKFQVNAWRLNATILDVNMPGLSVDPFTMIERLLSSNPTVPMIVISGQEIVLRHDFLKMGVYQYHGKPIDMMDLKITIEGALQYNRSMRKLENFERRQQDDVKHYKKLLGADVYEIEERIRAYDASGHQTPVVIRCDEGSRPLMLGEVISHELDEKLFFSKVCTQDLKNLLPPNLQHGDTLFLEGIENLGQEEVDSLRDLIKAQNTTEANGDGATPHFRLIVSTSLQPKDVGENRYHSEFIEELNAVEFRIEPLRLRQHEVREIVTQVFEKKKRETATKVENISDELFNHFEGYSWPLNFDELDIIITALLATCEESTLQQKHLHQLDFSNIANASYPSLDEMIEEHIKKALRLTMGNKSRAARMLGITPKTLYARIRQ